MNNARAKEIISIVIDILSRYLDNYRLYLFGSRVKGNNAEHADIDLAIETTCSDLLVKKAKSEVEELNTLYSIDLINIDKVDQDFKKIILKTGKIIYEK